jgi:subtilisin family serine protease
MRVRDRRTAFRVRRALRWGGCAILSLGVVAGIASAQVDAPAGPAAPYALSHVIVKLAPGSAPVRDDAGRWVIGRTGPETAETAVDRVNSVLRRHGVREIEPALRVGAQRADLATALGLERYHIVRIPAGGDPVALAASLRRHGQVVESVDFDGTGGVADVVPDDQFFESQYALRNTGQPINGSSGTAGADIRATEAWTITTGSTDVTLAIIDAGVNSHLDLDGRLVPGWNVVLNNADTSDSCSSHGTHVCGSAAANAGNASGIAGVDWNARIMPVRILNGCTGFESDLANGITWAVDNGADVLNMSLQFGVGSSFLHDAVIYAYEAGAILIAASGNNGFSGGVAFPGRWPETIAVAATNNRDVRASFSNVGQEVDIAAPGEDIYSLSGLSGYTFRDGTSMAAPHVAGLASLMRSIDPTLDTETVRSYLKDTAVDVGTAGFDPQTGWGRIDAYEALLLAQENIAVHGDVTGDGAVDVDDIIAVIFAWGACPEEGPCPADVNDSGVVDVDDLLAVMMNWS